VNVVDDRNHRTLLFLRSCDVGPGHRDFNRRDESGLSKKDQNELEDSFGEEYALLVSLVEEVRSTLRRKGIRVNAERWQNALDLDFLAQLLRTGQKDKAKAVLVKKLKKTN